MFRWSVGQQLSQNEFFLQFEKIDGKLCWRHEKNCVKVATVPFRVNKRFKSYKKKCECLDFAENSWHHQYNDVMCVLL